MKELPFLIILILLFGCTAQPAVEPEQPTPSPTPIASPTTTPTPTPTPASTPAPTPTPTDTPSDFQTQTFTVRDVSIILSFPADWKLSGNNVYSKEFSGTLTVAKQLHVKTCAENFAECVAKKYIAMDWQEFQLGKCNKSAVVRLSYREEKDIQRNLWVDFPEKEIGIMVTCTAINEEKEKQTCLKIFELLEC